ncbi:SfnB family sulfur acquisition oxidoreductase [Rhodococcus tibetensis]|uniref:SfnB family sulfur acquisition oxidoreductase n=1 Tax=Rhodococcus tibetensis TaxID=2965064 RepID=A0ABT1QG94_9NOCA|nr:SfnB family sulfur acquisition oxidoreductase [Rhodococcus sp. FXJ9.536]MCQ4121222.1 SfnB family sulfur acquisition oxidoreductase [Rhodococcus sp. FXJ9.536]
MTAVQNAHRITDEAEALAVAADLAAQFAADAPARDADRTLPYDEVRALARSGLLTLSVPREHGGIDARTETLTEVFRLLGEADPSIAQIPHSHYTFLEVLRLQGTAEQREFFYKEVLAGAQFANAQSERGTKTIDVDATTLLEDGTDFVVDGKKFYCTGALFADWIAVRATLRGTTTATGKPAKAVAYVPRSASGLSIVDDWDGMGQRTTASGTVTLDSVRVPASHVVPFSPIFDAPTTYGSQAQILHAAIDTGIASAALNEAVRSAHRSRPYFEAGVADAVDDPLLIQLAGEASLAVRAATAMLREGARSIDTARTSLTESTAAVASIDAAAAKVASARASLEASSVLFELGGTRSASESANLSRYWRDARTHTLHDPTRWKIQHIGRWTLSGTVPPRHGLL